MKTSAISKLSRVLCFLAAIALVISIFVPLWRIELDAPQYPEGLALLLYPHKIGGDVAIINGLNHYIGMQTLHAENFIEFKILPYLIAFYAMLSLIAGVAGKRKLLYFVFGAFVLFGIVAMADFWRWEYNYGHNLDPNAAIIVPGMAYQPPLIGFKQLLNFGAYSIPDKGGWMFIAAGVLLLAAVVMEANLFSKKRKFRTVMLVPFLGLLFASCSNSHPVSIRFNSDKCDFCKMTISDARFAAQMITEKGRPYKFDDLGCLTTYSKENTDLKFKSIWVNDYESGNNFIAAQTAFFVSSPELKSPMQGNTAAFINRESANELALKFHTEVVDWERVGLK